MSFYAFCPYKFQWFYLSTLPYSNLPLLRKEMCGEGRRTFQLNGPCISKLAPEGPSMIKLANYQCLGRLHFHWYNKEMGGLDFGF